MAITEVLLIVILWLKKFKIFSFVLDMNGASRYERNVLFAPIKYIFVRTHYKTCFAYFCYHVTVSHPTHVTLIVRKLILSPVRVSKIY